VNRAASNISRLAILLFAVGCACCHRRAELRAEEGRVAGKVTAGAPASEIPDSAFDNVEPNSYVRYPCTPKIPNDDLDWRGILLSAPSQSLFTPGQHDYLTGSFGPVQVCGISCFKYDTLGLNGDFLEKIVLVATDTQSHAVFSGRMQVAMNGPAGGNPGPQTFGLTHDDLKDRVTVEYFNPNLAYVLHLPEAEAEYLVHATLGPYKSNVVRVRVKKRN